VQPCLARPIFGAELFTGTDPGDRGDWWTLLIVRDAFLGVRRFGDFQKSLGIARNILAARLQRLAENGILDRGGSEKVLSTSSPIGVARCYRHGRPDAMGRQMGIANKPPVMVTMTTAAGGTGQIEKRGGDVTAETVRFHPGPGATARTRAFFNGLSCRAAPALRQKTIPKKSR